MAKRIQVYWGAWKTITGIKCDIKVPDKVEGRMHRTMMRPAMLYGIVAVTVTKGKEEKMQEAEIKMLR